MSIDKHNIFDLLKERAFGPTGSEPAIHWEGRSLRWDQVERAAREVAGGLLNLGVSQGDRVAVMLPNVPPYLFLQYAIHLIGAILVPIHELTRVQELGYQLEDSEAKFLFAWGDYSDTVEAAVQQTESLVNVIEVGSSKSDPYDIVSWMEDADPYEGDPVGGGNDTAFIRYTAGVTGRTKGAMISHKNVLFVAEESDNVLRILEKDNVLGAMPFYHPFGSTLELQMLLPSGAALMMHTHFDAEKILKQIRDREVSIFIGLPVHMAELVEAAGEEKEIGKLRFAVFGGGPIDLNVMKQFESIFKTRVATIYGTCETSPTIAINPSHRSDTPREALGRIISGMDVRIVDESNEEVSVGEVGEIVVQGKGLFKGYWNRPNATHIAIDSEGWFHTQDVGKIDIDGWLFGAGRLHDRINKAGFSIFPREVEQVLNAHPNVKECAVIGISHRQLGEDIIAYVVPMAGMTIVGKDLIEYCTNHLAKYKTPSSIFVEEKLPKSRNGVILRRKMREKHENN